jgi:hypothetical protein
VPMLANYFWVSMDELFDFSPTHDSNGWYITTRLFA